MQTQILGTFFEKRKWRLLLHNVMSYVLPSFHLIFKKKKDKSWHLPVLLSMISTLLPSLCSARTSNEDAVYTIEDFYAQVLEDLPKKYYNYFDLYDYVHKSQQELYFLMASFKNGDYDSPSQWLSESQWFAERKNPDFITQSIDDAGYRARKHSFEGGLKDNWRVLVRNA